MNTIDPPTLTWLAFAVCREWRSYRSVCVADGDSWARADDPTRRGPTVTITRQHAEKIVRSIHAA